MYLPMAFCTASLATTMSILVPAVPESATSCWARSRSGPDHGASDRAGDVAGELEAGETSRGQIGDQAGQFRAGLHPEQLAVQRGCFVARQHSEAG